LIDPRKIDEWIREVEERPASAEGIIRLISNRLSELDRMNEQLRDENIQLQSGKKVEEFQRRIDILEYQLDLLKRQLTPETVSVEPATDLLIYNSQGQVLRIEAGFRETGSRLGSFLQIIDLGNLNPRLLLVEEQEEALYLFDSGRVTTLPVAQIPKVEPDKLEWKDAFLQEPRIGEELVAVLPVARMSLFDYCIQASRRGYVRKVAEAFFENHLSRGFIGSGVRLETDRPGGLSFGNKEDLFGMVSREGILFSMEIARLPATVEEAVKLEPTDHIIALFNTRAKSSLIFVTQNGKVIHRDLSWLEPATALKYKGQAILSKERRARGIRIVAAAPIVEDDWGAALLNDGNIYFYRLRDLFNTGSILEMNANAEVLSFTVFSGQPEENMQGIV
jgi:DNA gyrase/topoisomerase IV subunit A